MEERNGQHPPDRSRRRFLKYSGAALGGAVVGGVIGGAIVGGLNNRGGKGNGTGSAGNNKDNAAADYNQAAMFFTLQQLRITEAAAERIFPKDELGPGAAELGVAYFIDHQMASPFGVNAREYRMGPFFKAEPTQGEHVRIPRRDLFTMGIQALEDTAKSKYGKPFAELSDEEKDAVLAMMENGEIPVVDSGTGKAFFNLLRRLTLEGVYADPLYGGNKNMQGWAMRKYPGNQMSYTDIMESDKFVEIAPKSLRHHLVSE
ncbi:gluconate 2-dehydrogenase subunit 3 family protein [Paenibacillus thermoaerophilus]|uniref:Gluconate 2-dehydrogenase subunit 3 family protein n=1 Tax=Paenibacillus thermoaerophilus TaxID=1215385 RepID=A0ABW2V1E2_9BACL|nr:gluconate 2-dehydrogenase subunit 3 family protein [Paenibacillus thermoaerophilus]TMV14364.1 gluconate 2-dehydrogenase subunit 3 family protein [Paenibacillus thermoaerophilus]